MKFIHLCFFGLVYTCAINVSFLSAQSTCEVPCSRNDCGAVNYDVSPIDSLVCEGSILRFKNNTAIQTYTGLVIRWGDGKQDTVFQLNDFYHKYDLPESLKATCQNDTILRLTVCITAFKQCNEGFTCSQKVQSFPIKIALKPKAAFVPSATTACVGARLSFQNKTCFSNAALYTWRYSTFRITNIRDINLDYDLPGQYDVELTARNSCGADSVKQVITILEKPKADIIIDTQQFCYPISVRLKNKQTNSSDGVWKITGDTSVWESVLSFPSGDSTWIRFKRLGAINIKLLTSNGCGADSISMPFILKSTPFFKTDSEVNLCQEGFVSPESLLFTYDKLRINSLIWKVNNESPFTAQGSTFQPALFKKNGTIDLQTNGQCGTFHHTIRIQVFPKDTLKLSKKAVSFCSNDAPVQLTASPAGTWSGFGISSTGRIDPSLFLNKSKGIVYFDASNPYCTLRDSVSLTITDPMTVALAPVSPLCENEEFTPIYAVNGNFTGIKWIVNGGSATNLNGLDPGKIRFSNPGVFGITLQATNICGTVFDTTTVRVFSKPIMESLSVSSACIGDKSDLRLIMSNRDNEALKISISLSGSPLFDTVITGNTLIWSFRPFANVGNYPLKVVVSKGTNCTSELISELKIIQKPSLSLAKINSFCSNVEFTPSLTTSGAFETLKWSFPGGIPSSFVGLNPGKVKYNITGKFTVKVEGVSSCGSSADSLLLDVIEQPNISRFTATPVCLGNESSVSMKWLNLSGNPVKIQLFQSGIILLDTTLKGDIIDYKYFPPKINGLYPLTLVTTAGNQCKSESKTEVNVFSSPPVSILDLKSNLCVATDKIELKGNPTGGKFSGLGVIDLLNGKFQLPIGTGIADRWIYYDYTDSGGCKGRDSLFLKEIKQSPTLQFENLISSYCKSDKWIEFKVKPTGGLFKIGSGPLVESVNKDAGLYRFKPLTSGEFAISYRYSDNSGCLDSLDWKFSVADKFPFDPAVDTFILSGQKLVIGKPAIAGYSYRWFDGSTQSTYTVEDPGIYTLEVFNVASGCSVVDTIKVSFGGVNSIKESLQSISLLDVYPNPCNEYLFIKNKNRDNQKAKLYLIRVLDVYGKVLKTVEISSFEEEVMIDVSFLPSGMYFIEGYGKTQRVIKI